MDSLVPTHSSTESAPTFFVSSLMRATPASPRSETMSVAPYSSARSWPRLVAAHRDDPLRPHLLGGEHAHEADRAVADDGDGRAFLHARRVGRIPAGAEHVRNGEIARDQVIGGQFGRGDQRAVGERNPRKRRLRAAHEFALLAGGLKAEAAMRAGIVGKAESRRQIARTHGCDRAADFLDDAAIFVTHRHRRGDGVQTPERPEIGTADATRREPDDRVGRLLDFRLGDLFAATSRGP